MRSARGASGSSRSSRPETSRCPSCWSGCSSKCSSVASSARACGADTRAHPSTLALADGSSRLGLVKRAGARSERETAAIGCADDSSLDPVDVVRGLAHMDVLIERVSRASRSRDRGRVHLPRNAQERHLQEEGHLLRFGCCRPEPSGFTYTPAQSSSEAA